MSSKRAIRRRACTSKQRFETLDAAWTALRSLKRRLQLHDAMNAYACRFCGGFHFGHMPGALLRNRRG